MLSSDEKKIRYLEKAFSVLKLIAEGYFVDTLNDQFVRVENPNYAPDNGEDPYICFDTGVIFAGEEWLTPE